MSYALAAVAVVVTLVLRWALIPVIGSGTIYITLFPAMIVVAVTFGTGPGLLGNALGIALIEYFLIEPRGHLQLSVSLALRSVLMLGTTYYVGRVGDRLRSARIRADTEAAAAREAEAALRRDNAERRRAEEALFRSREGLSRLAEASLSVMARTDLAGMLQATSDAALALTGARVATCGHGLVDGQWVVGGSSRRPGAPECPPDDMFRVEKGGVHMLLAEGADSLRLGEEELRRDARWWGLPEGHVPLRGLLGVPMRGRGDRPSGMILVSDKAEGEFTEEDQALLEQLGTVASLALQHVGARISLEESDRRKTDFLAMLSHELRNPLAPIRNSVFVLGQAAAGSEQARRAHAIIDRQVTQLTHLVDDLLDVTRISRGKVLLRREGVDLAEVVRRAVEDHRAGFASSSVELSAVIPDQPVPVHGDRTRLAQVMGNLLHNASKFTPAGGTVTVSVEAQRELGQAVARVRDTGCGIAPEMLPRVFEPFVQAETTLDRSRGGLGLGLALVRGIVELHGGTAGVESRGTGQGAEFTVRFPLGP